MNVQPASARLTSIDALRGLVMVIMTLDHTRDFFSDAHFKPTDLQQTNVALFLTRWVTHFCAPVFVFLAGASAFLWFARKGRNAPISGFLLKRGLLLLLLTCSVEAWSWNFLNDFRQVDGGVLWAIGWSMIVLAGLAKLPVAIVGLIGLTIVAGHNALDGIRAQDLGGFAPWWAILHTGEDVALGNGWSINPYYPLLPWIGVIALGFGFGSWLQRNEPGTRFKLIAAGTGLTLLFIALRYANVYGDPDPWQVQATPAFTVLSFLNCHKYPPSLLYLLMTLGPALIVLGMLHQKPLPAQHPLLLFGRTPLFFYLIHLYVIHGLAVGLAAVSGGPVREIAGGGIWSPNLPADYGYGLASVYAIWLVVVVLMLRLCRGFERLKTANPHWTWMNYL